MVKYAKKHSISICAVMASAVIVAVIAMLTFLTPNVTAFAAALGAETPEIYCTYTKDNEEVDGNRLTAGTYDVSFYIKGVENISTLQLTATYDSSVTIDSSSLSLISDNQVDVTSMGPVIDNAGGNLVLGFVSDNANYSSINPEGQLLATMSVTFAADCDAASVIVPSTNPHHTFVQVDYADSYTDEYALVSNEEAADYNGVLYPMTCDITPSKGHSVSGSLVIMTNAEGQSNGTAVYGDYTINIYASPDMKTTEPIKTINSVYTAKTEDTEASNLFTIDTLPSGTYYVSISSDYAVTRNDIVITMGNEDIADVIIPVVVCDYNKDNGVSVADAGALFTSAAGESSLYYDLNGDNGVSVADAGIIYACATSDNYYKGFEIK